MSGYPDDGELVLEIGGAKVSGWQAIRVTRGIERMPSDFDIAATEKYPGLPGEVFLAAGLVCRVRIGGDLVLTGYVDRYQPSIAAASHEVRVSGRSACADLVDCMAWLKPNGVLNGTSARKIVERVAAAYDIKTTFRAAKDTDVVQFVVTLGDTCWTVIEQVTRWGAMLAYDDPTGNLVLADVGTDRMASGPTEGLNVLSASPTFSIDQRFLEYHSYIMATDSLSDTAAETGRNGNELTEVVIDPGMQGLKTPNGAPRIRRMALIGEQIDSRGSLLLRRAKWEMARRYGRSQAIRVEVDSWRDKEGKLWEPNFLVPVHLPTCKMQDVTWVIGEVTYIRDGQGTRASLLIMPPEAFQPEPTIQNQFDFQIYKDLHPEANPDDNVRAHEQTGGI